MSDNTLRCTLVTDGSSDRALLPILTWWLENHLATYTGEPAWENLTGLSLPDKIRKALELNPCDLLFVHRDAENQPPNWRVQEIRQALDQVAEQVPVPPYLCVVPVRMSEAWLLIDKQAIRTAADNPNGRQRLHLPPLSELEDIPNPKEALYDLLRDASDLGVRRLERFNRDMVQKVFRVAESISDFSPLLELPSFKQLTKDLGDVIRLQGWE